MPATYCIGPFVQRLSRLPLDRAAWAAEIEKQPDTCPRGCNVNCKDACKAVANVQWKCAQRAKR